MKEIKISIIVPVFNEEKTLNTILEKINQQKINALIACAGILKLGSLEEMSTEDFDLVFDI